MSYASDTSDLTPEQTLLKRETHRFAEEVLRPASMELDGLSAEEVIAPGSRLWHVFKTAYSSGYHLRGFPPDMGGAALGPLEGHIVSEEMGWGSAGLSISLGVASMPFRFALMTGHPDLMREVVMPFVEDREGRYIGCWGATEPNHGSDGILYGSGGDNNPSIHLDCTAVKDGDEWVINGQKSAWVSNGTIATHTLASLNVRPEWGMRGTGTAIIPLGLPGVTRGKPTNKLGQRALNQGEIFFDNVRIPSYYMIAEPTGEPGRTDGLAGPNASMSATFAGVARAAFEEALSYAQKRVQGGVPIARHQLVQKRLFDMFMRVEAAHALSRKAVLRLATGQLTAHYSMAAKVFATRTAFDVASDASEIFGAMGMVKGVLVEQLMRDARAGLIEDGANDTLALAAARRLLDD